jgi:calcineurin-like phosphoesterase family protein
VTIWFTSDSHYLHHHVATLRGFSSCKEHDDHVIAQHNKLVKPDDIVWHLGDVGIAHTAELLPVVARLNGRQQLITGNHDAPFPGHRDARRHQKVWLEVFDSVQAYARVRIAGQEFMLSHFPYSGDHTGQERYSQYRLRDDGMWLLHGHVHSKQKLWSTGPR